MVPDDVDKTIDFEKVLAIFLSENAEVNKDDVKILNKLNN